MHTSEYATEGMLTFLPLSDSIHCQDGDEMSKLTAMSRLKSPVMKGGRCLTCERYGACSDWVIWAAFQCHVPPEFLARKVLKGLISSQTPLEEITRLYEQEGRTGFSG